MLSTIWTGANNASDIFLLVAVILAGIAALIRAVPSMPDHPSGILVAAAICFIGLGLLAV